MDGTIQINRYVDKLIINNEADYKKYPIYTSDLDDIEREELAVKLFDQDIDRADFLVEHIDQFTKELRDYIKEDSICNAIELASKFKEIFMKHYEYKMNNILDQRQDYLRAY